MDRDRWKWALSAFAVLLFGTSGWYIVTNMHTWKSAAMEEEERPLSLQEMRQHLRREMARSRAIYNMNPDNKTKLNSKEGRIPIFLME